jgi:GDPmannose 4,6-dehydratase
MAMTRESRVALITGVTGQDGAHLASHLLRDGYTVYGGFRRGSSNKTWRLDYLGITRKVKLVEFQLSEPLCFIELLRDIQPDEIYCLAGESFVADSFRYPGVAVETNTHGTVNMLEAIRLMSPHARSFFASSSEIFGNCDADELKTERSHCRPTNPYGISKLAGQHFVDVYRQRHGVYACSGILFNHEGPLRGREYVTRKITFNLARLREVGGSSFELGNLDSGRDWGAAADYVEAMRAMLGMTTPEDLVIASGQLTTVRDFLAMAARAAGFDPEFTGEGLDETCIDRKSGRTLVSVSPRYFRPLDTPPLRGDSGRIEAATSWRRGIAIDAMISQMVESDIDRWKRGITNV